MATVSVVRVSSATNAQECVTQGAVSKSSGKAVTKFSARHSFEDSNNPLTTRKKGQKIQTPFTKMQETSDLYKRKCTFQVGGDPTLCLSVWQK